MDDNDDLVQLVEVVVGSSDDLRVVASAASVEAALAADEQLEPDVVLLDVVLGDQDGLEVLEGLVTARPDRPVVVMSGLGDHVGGEALARGAAGFITKGPSFAEDAPCVLRHVLDEPSDEAAPTVDRYGVAVGWAGIAVLVGLVATVGVPSAPLLTLAFGVVAAFTYHVPVAVLTSGRTDRYVHLTAQVFVAAVLLLPAPEAALAMAVGGSIGAGSRALPLDRRFCAVGVITIQYTIGATVFDVLGSTVASGGTWSSSVGRDLAAAAVASACAMVVNVALVAPSECREGVPVRSFLAGVAPTCAVVWLGAAPVGAAAGILGRHQLAALGLLVFPQAVVLVWSAQQGRLRQEQHRVSVLLDMSTAAHAASSRSEVETIVATAAATLLDDPSAAIVHETPTQGPSVPVDADPPCWLVAPGAAEDPGSRKVLEGLAATAAVALRQVDQYAEVRSAADQDPLTRLANIAVFRPAVERAIALADRDRSSVTVMYLDLDGFKPVNDTYGHAAGDAILRAVASRLRREVRACDLPARVGGDEFAVLFPGVGSNRACVESTRERLELALGEPVDLGDVTVRVEASVGVATFPDDGHDAAALLEAADLDMYRRKVTASHGRTDRRDVREAPPVPPVLD